MNAERVKAIAREYTSAIWSVLLAVLLTCWAVYFMATWIRMLWHLFMVGAS